MLARVGNLLLALALLGATGAHWAVLQSVAWTTMIVENSRTERLGTVVVETLSGAKPCDLCKRIAAGKQSERKAEFPQLSGKLEFIYSPPGPALFPPQFAPDAVRPAALPAVLSHAPPVPPPRTLQG